MSFLDQLGPMLRQYAEGQPPASEAEAHAHYDQISDAVPAHQLAPVIGAALGTLSPQDLRGRVTASAAQMSTPQRTSLVETLLAGLGPNVASVLATLGLDPALAHNPAQASSVNRTGIVGQRIS